MAPAVPLMRVGVPLASTRSRVSWALNGVSSAFALALRRADERVGVAEMPVRRFRAESEVLCDEVGVFSRSRMFRLWNFGVVGGLCVLAWFD